MDVAEIALRTCFCGTELAGLERLLVRQAGVQAVSIDRTRSIVHVGYDQVTTGPTQLAAALETAGYRCDCRDCAASCCQPGHPAAGTADEVASHHRHPSHQVARSTNHEHLAPGGQAEHNEHAGPNIRDTQRLLSTNIRAPTIRDTPGRPSTTNMRATAPRWSTPCCAGSSFRRS
jgi:hypothetical protein